MMFLLLDQGLTWNTERFAQEVAFGCLRNAFGNRVPVSYCLGFKFRINYVYIISELRQFAERNRFVQKNCSGEVDVSTMSFSSVWSFFFTVSPALKALEM